MRTKYIYDWKKRLSGRGKEIKWVCFIFVTSTIYMYVKQSVYTTWWCTCTFQNTSASTPRVKVLYFYSKRNLVMISSKKGRLYQSFIEWHLLTKRERRFWRIWEGLKNEISNDLFVTFQWFDRWMKMYLCFPHQIQKMMRYEGMSCTKLLNWRQESDICLVQKRGYDVCLYVG